MAPGATLADSAAEFHKRVGGTNGDCPTGSADVERHLKGGRYGSGGRGNDVRCGSKTDYAVAGDAVPPGCFTLDQSLLNRSGPGSSGGLLVGSPLYLGAILGATIAPFAKDTRHC
jgi:hypothetical protein